MSMFDWFVAGFCFCGGMKLYGTLRIMIVNLAKRWLEKSCKALAKYEADGDEVAHQACDYLRKKYVTPQQPKDNIIGFKY